jgi:hypothetical protein
MARVDKDFDAEVAALKVVIETLKPLNAETQTRIIEYVCQRFELRQGRRRDLDESDGESTVSRGESSEAREDARARHRHEIEKDSEAKTESTATLREDNDETLTGISPVAQKWMTRNQFTASDLGRLFTLGVDDIDLVARSLPGKSVQSRFREVILLEGIAAYLGGGVARFTQKKLKEALRAYNADPDTNFTKYLKKIGTDVQGTAAGGYTLTSRGLHSATELLKTMLNTAEPKRK